MARQTSEQKAAQAEREAAAQVEVAARDAEQAANGGETEDDDEGGNVTPMRRRMEEVGNPVEGAQASAFAPPPGSGAAPKGYVQPPHRDDFNNATHLLCGPDVAKIVDKVLKFPEFKDLHSFDYAAVWRLKTKPFRAGSPVYVTTEITPLLYRFLSEGALPQFVLDLHWQHFDDLRNESNFVHPETLERHIHSALMALTVSEEMQIGKQAPTVQVFPETVKRYGLHEPGLVSLQGAFDLWGQKAASAQP